MPSVCRFNGLIIYMFSNEGIHKEPHLHVYDDHRDILSVNILNLKPRRGNWNNLNSKNRKLLKK